jgi:hypothetical protein
MALKLFADCETQEGLGALRDILAGLAPEEFVGGAVRGLVGVGEPSEDVAQIVAEEGAKRVNDLLARNEHLLAARTAGVCTPAVFLRTCREGLTAHDDEEDPVRLAILELFGEKSELVNELGRDDLFEEEPDILAEIEVSIKMYRDDDEDA